MFLQALFAASVNSVARSRAGTTLCQVVSMEPLNTTSEARLKRESRHKPEQSEIVAWE